MRSIFGVLSLLLVLLWVGFLAKTQLQTVDGMKVPEASGSAASAPPFAPGSSTAGNVLSQPQQIQQQIKAATEAAMQRNQTLTDGNTETPRKN
ncbi:MAG: hypothetical protein WCH35_01055 [Comamonadaceae bacterium]